MKRVLVVLSDGYRMCRKGGRLCVRTDRGESSFPTSHLSSLFLIGNGTISTEAVDMLLRSDVSLVLLSKYYRIKGFFIGEDKPSPVVERRLKQYDLWKKARLETAKRIVSMKIESIQQNFNIDLSYLIPLLEGQKSIEELMGYEGLASRFMMEQVSELLPDFKGREYRPPTDPVNATLSFVYCVAYNMAKGLILSLGFDPYISFLHTRRGKHASFASDLIEPLRPHLTSSVVKLFQEGHLNRHHFVREGRAFYLNRDGVNQLLIALEDSAQSYADILWETLLKLMEMEHEDSGV